MLTVGGCGSGSSTFRDVPRPPVPLQLTGVVSNDKVTISPNNIGAGPIVLVISNQTQQSQTITLERSGSQGEPNRDVVGPVNPLQPATLQQTLTPGQYTVSVDSATSGIAPAVINVGASRPSSSNTPLLP